MQTQTRVQSVLVTCVTMRNPFCDCEGITYIGGADWRLSKEQVIAELELPQPRYEFYTNVRNKKAVIRVVNGVNGKYIQTFADGYPNNNLLELDPC